MITSATAAAKISEVLRASLRPPHRALDARIVASGVVHLKLLRRQGREITNKFGSVAKITSPSALQD
jgi:hypothetical protein